MRIQGGNKMKKVILMVLVVVFAISTSVFAELEVAKDDDAHLLIKSFNTGNVGINLESNAQAVGKIESNSSGSMTYDSLIQHSFDIGGTPKLLLNSSVIQASNDIDLQGNRLLNAFPATQCQGVNNKLVGITSAGEYICEPDAEGLDNLGDHIARENIRLGSWWLSNDGQNKGLTIDADGKIGIGTALPQSDLHVESDSTDYTSIRIQNTQSTNGIWELRTYDGAPLDNGFSIYGGKGASLADRFVIEEDSWFVGIGKTNPQNQLDVNGTVQMTGLKMATNAVDGYVLTSDSLGNGTWQQALAVGLPAGNLNETLRHDGNAWVSAGNLTNDGTDLELTDGHLNIYNTLGNTASLRLQGLGIQGGGNIAFVNEEGSTNSSIQGMNGMLTLTSYSSVRMQLNPPSIAMLLNEDGLEINSSIKMDGFQLGDSATAGQVLTADENGVGTWQTISSGGDSAWSANANGINYNDDGTSLPTNENVGIGTTSPAKLLHVQGNQSFGSVLFERKNNAYPNVGHGIVQIKATLNGSPEPLEMEDGFGPMIGFYVEDDTYSPPDNKPIAQIYAYRDAGANTAGGLNIRTTLDGLDYDNQISIKPSGKIGIGDTESEPNSLLTVAREGYFRLGIISSSPPSEDCNEFDEAGRMTFSNGSDAKLFVCTYQGWKEVTLKALTP